MQDLFNASRVQAIAGTTSSGMPTESFQAAVNSSEAYVFVIINSAEQANQSAVALVSFSLEASSGDII